MPAAPGPEADLLTLAVENAELRLELAEAQEQCIELAVNAGELHAEVEALRMQLAAMEAEREALRVTLEQSDHVRLRTSRHQGDAHMRSAPRGRFLPRLRAALMGGLSS